MNRPEYPWRARYWEECLVDVAEAAEAFFVEMARDDPAHVARLRQRQMDLQVMIDRYNEAWATRGQEDDNWNTPRTRAHLVPRREWLFMARSGFEWLRKVSI